MSLTLKQTVKEVGLSADTLRYYEKMGVISSNRHDNGYRLGIRMTSGHPNA